LDEAAKILTEALDIWVDLSGVDPEQTSFTISLGRGMSELDFHDCHHQLKKGLEMDHTGVTTCMLLRGFVDYYMKVTGISLDYIIREQEDFEKEIGKVKRLRSLMERPVVADAVKEFRDYIIKAAKHYGYDHKKVDEAFEDRDAVGMSRYHALLAAERLTEYQFSSGKYDPEPPQFYKGILKFPSIQMAINFMASHKQSIIALALIRDDYNDLYSHFAFMLKNGENTYLLSDDEEWVHPMQKEMSRRPDRHLERKEFLGYLPYQLIDKFDDEEVDPDKGKGSLLASIKDLPIKQIVWLTVVFEKLRQIFWNEKRQLKQISHFMGNVSAGYSSVKQLKEGKPKQGANLPVHISAFKLPKVKKKEVTTKSMEEDWEREPTKQNEWLEKRYEKHVPDFVLNPDLRKLSAKQVKLLEDGKKKEETEPHWYTPPKVLLRYAIQGRVNKKALDHCRSDLRVMPETHFGTVEQLQKTQRWHARYNKATMIRYYAEKEFIEREEKIRQWWKDSIKEQRDRLIEIAVRGELMAPYVKPRMGFESGRDIQEANLVRMNKGKSPFGGSWGKAVAIIGSIDWHRSKYYCPLTDSVATLFVTMEPKTAEALAIVLGCKVKDLPDVLQNWWKGDEYIGNSILENLDPMEWVVKDPWKELSFKVIIPFSRRGFKRMRKELGLDPVDFEALEDEGRGW
jgi:hypothetical protein